MHNIYYLGHSGEHCCPLGYLFSNIFFPETAWPINAKFHVEPSWAMGKKVYINGWLVLNVPVNNFSVMLERSHRFLAITSTFGE